MSRSEGIAELNIRAARVAAEAGAWANYAKSVQAAAAPARTWSPEPTPDAPEAARTADPAATPVGVGPPDPADRDRLIAELDALEGELAAGRPDGDPVLATVRARLGGLYVLRYLNHHRADDRSRGLRVLRAARESGELVPKELIAVETGLAALLLPPIAFNGLDGTLPRLLEMVEMGRQAELRGSDFDRDLTELGEILRGLLPRMPDHPEAERMARLADWIDTRPKAGEREDLAGLADTARLMLAGTPYEAEYQRLLDAALMLAGGDRPPGEGPRESLVPPPPQDGRPAGEEDPAAMVARTVLSLEAFAPGLIRREELDALATEVGDRPGADEADTMTAALARMMQGLRTGAPGDLEEAARLMKGPPDGGATEWLPAMAGLFSPGLLSAAALTGGSLSDRDQQIARLDALLADPAAVLDTSFASGPAREFLLINQCLRIQLRAEQAGRDDDVPAMEGLLDELLDLQEEVDADSDWYFLVCFTLGTVHLYLARMEGVLGPLRTAAAYFQETLEGARIPPMLRPLLEVSWLPIVLLSSLFDPDPVRLTEGLERARATLRTPALVADQHVRTRLVMATALETLYRKTGDPSHQEEQIAELERARGELGEGHSPDAAQQVLWSLANAYRARGDRARDDGGSAVAAARDSLRVLAEEVLLQLGAEHGLEVARTSAERGLPAAGWAAGDLRADRAVEVLETGRALVLRAAAASAGVPEQLAARGEPELAAEWENALRKLRPAERRPALPGDASADWENVVGQILPSGSPEEFTIPSTLRRRALGVLRQPDGGGRDSLRELLEAPGIAELREGLTATGADALLYLVPGQDSMDGMAVLVRPEGEPEVLWLPGLGAAGRGPLERYLDAGAHRSAARSLDRAAREEAHRAWEAALLELCAWSGVAVMAPVLDALGALSPDGTAPPGGPGESRDAHGPGGQAASGGPVPPLPPPVRLVVVACGNLGVVPWHAARLDLPSPTLRRAHSHLCEHAVLTYAASGAEFLRSARRARMAVGERPVLVADPTGDLAWAEDEVSALRTAYYPGAALYGWHDDAPEDAPGTPDDILGRLPGGHPTTPPASLLHLVVHGLAGLNPTGSVLHLAPPAGADARGDGDSGDSGDGGDSGLLSVARLLDVPHGHRPDQGPLIVLSACETDLSSRDHDEALTLSTALLARGAADVVGSRWEVPDTASAALMVVFHHHLAVEGLAPADALRAAQVWMTDPDRRPVPGLRGDLLTGVERDPGHLAEPASWAAFTHQGNPAPRPPR
ncbi:CHAT domain-containing protein [Streptomyces sp. NPDC001985]|uniref:CHAT domain-containing protein n=1 Tax=Streptomyces sp. NPDC001985 TaxID=3154406 RepID=UPI003325DE1C